MHACAHCVEMHAPTPRLISRLCPMAHIPWFTEGHVEDLRHDQLKKLFLHPTLVNPILSSELDLQQAVWDTTGWCGVTWGGVG